MDTNKIDVDSIDTDSIKKGDILSESQYYVVKGITSYGVSVVNDRGFAFKMGKDIVAESCYSADQYVTETELTRTELIDVFIHSPGIAMTVNFNKKKKESEVKKELYTLYANKNGRLLSETAYKKAVNKITKDLFLGEERTMLGRHYSHRDGNGRVSFIDMQKPIKTTTTKDGFEYDTRQRLVDPRTINWLIVKNTKYVIK